MRATLSIRGIHNYTHGRIWDGLDVPDAISKEYLIMQIVDECAELEILYPDEFYLKRAIGWWSHGEKEIWEKLYNTTQFDYNPIWNKDGTVTETETSHRLHSGLANDSESESEDETGHNIYAGKGNDESSDRSEGSASHVTGSDTEQTTQVAAYDSATFQNREKVDTSADTVDNSQSETENSGSRDTEQEDMTATDRSTDRSSDRETDRNEMDANDRVYERRETGNIGVTTTQQMIKEEREVDQFDIYDYIVNSFKRRFCLLVY